MKKCTNCGAEAYRNESRFCKSCGTGLPEHDNAAPNVNICMNPACGQHTGKFIYPNETHFCDMCGSKTAFAPQ
jgi:rRNA maturation endonuclease Nob1